jgi:FdhE protein
MSGPADLIDTVIQRLRNVLRESPHLKDAAQLYETILPLLIDVELCAGTLSITPDQARTKMEMGLPLLHDLNLELDGQAVCDLMLRLVRALETADWNSNELKAEARRTRLAIEEGTLDFGSMLPDIVAGRKDLLMSSAESLQLDCDLIWTLSQNALKPALRAWSQQLTPLAEGVTWDKGFCFVCGAGATLGEFQGNNMVKHLRCGQCGADWLFHRVQCMYCGNEDHKTLGYLYVENQPDKMRTEVCDKCRGYLKVIPAFSPTPAEILQVEDLATLHLDYIAQKRGYTRGNNPE